MSKSVSHYGYLPVLNLFRRPVEHGKRVSFRVEDDLVEIIFAIVLAEEQPEILECLRKEITW